MEPSLRRDTAPAPGLPEPYGALFAFLGDLWEQADLARAEFSTDPLAIAVLEELQARISALAVTVRLAAGVVTKITPPKA